MSDRTDERPCANCQKPAGYQGTQDRQRIYRCPDGHLTFVGTDGKARLA